MTYRIVGDDEADFKKNLISVNSPMARGLIGKEQDDVVVIKTRRRRGVRDPEGRVPLIEAVGH